MTTCKTCRCELINYNGLFFLHPDSKCQEKDGWQLNLIDEFLTKQFDIKYGSPLYDPRDYVRLIEVFRRLEKLMFWKRYRKKTKVCQ